MHANRCCSVNPVRLRTRPATSTCRCFSSTAPVEIRPAPTPPASRWPWVRDIPEYLLLICSSHSVAASCSDLCVPRWLTYGMGLGSSCTRSVGSVGPSVGCCSWISIQRGPEINRILNIAHSLISLHTKKRLESAGRTILSTALRGRFTTQRSTSSYVSILYISTPGRARIRN